MKTKEQSMEKDLLDKELLFRNSLDPEQKTLILKVKAVIDKVDIGPDSRGFASWSPDKLILAKEKLSRYSEPIGEWISYHATRSDFSYIWRKGKMAAEFSPLKAKLAKDLKTTNLEVENLLTEKYLDQQYFSLFHRRQADYLIILMETVSKMIRSIDSQLRELERQFKLPQNGQS